MQENKISILSTRPLSEFLIEKARLANIELEVDSFIETEPIQSVEVQQEIELAMLEIATVVFTSMNAVESVASWLEGVQPDWEIYCVGNTTKQLIENYFGEERIAGTADDAESLAELIVDAATAKEVIFFCGDQRRPELPETLNQNGIDVNEIVVYQTIPKPHKLTKEFGGILFFSPTAVQSFFRCNQVTQNTILFAIGKTTAGEIEKNSGNKVIISEETSRDGMIQTVIDFFS